MNASFTHPQNIVARSKTAQPGSPTTLTQGNVQINGTTEDHPPRPMSSTTMDMPDQRLKALVQGVDKLKSLGIEQTTLPLPKIVVVGDQSAGKIALVEEISGVTLPQSNGTCNRCPMYIILRSSDDPDAGWTCRITLQREYSFDPHMVDGPFGQWGQDEFATETSFAMVHDKTKLEQMIRRAQFATLNPDDDVSKYISGNVDELTARFGFSPNVIKLDIVDCGLPALSFYDLPGIIDVPNNSDEEWPVEYIENLVRSYVKEENSIILLASDIQNSRASKLIEEYPGAKQETVDCLIKPDCIPRGPDIRGPYKLLSTKSFEVGPKYHVILQPFQNMLDQGVTPDIACNAKEPRLALGPWATTLGGDQLSTKELIVALSELLTLEISSSLPVISRNVQARLQDVEAQLTTYADPPTNALTCVLDILNRFESATERYIECMPQFEELRNTTQKLAMIFRTGLKDIRPRLIVNTPPGFDQPTLVTINLLSDDESGQEEYRSPTSMNEGTPTKRRIINVNGTSTPSRMASGTAPAPRRGIVRKAIPQAQSPQIPCETIALLDVRNILQGLASPSITNEITPCAVDHLRSRGVDCWRAPMEAFLGSTTNILKARLLQTLEEKCREWATTEFHREARKIVSVFVESVMQEQKTFAIRALNLELHKPMTLNQEAIEIQRVAELAHLTEARTQRRAVEYLTRLERTCGKVATDQERARKAREKKIRDELSTLGPDPFQPEIEVIARVRAYYNVASFRFLDHVVQGVEAEAFQKCCKELPQQLKSGLMLEVEPGQADDNATRLLVEGPARELHRTRLKNEREKLLQALQWVLQLESASD